MNKVMEGSKCRTYTVKQEPDVCLEYDYEG